MSVSLESDGAASARDPQDAEAQLRVALTSLSLGDWTNGWRGYEWRLSVPRLSVEPPANVPRWDGGVDPTGRTILVQCEPNPGDCIQFARYLPLLSGRGADVVVVAPHPLVRLFGSIPGVCVIPQGDPAPRADLYVPIGSLPLAFATTPATVPTFGAYLRADGRLSAAWKDRLRPRRTGGRKVVGVDARLVLSEVPSGIELLAVSAHLHDLADTAALLSQLDLVLATDDAVAHLAGALGKPVWTLVPFPADWRWGAAGDDTAWYPSMRLFRQTTADDWSDVPPDVLAELKRFNPPHASLAA